MTKYNMLALLILAITCSQVSASSQRGLQILLRAYNEQNQQTCQVVSQAQYAPVLAAREKLVCLEVREENVQKHNPSFVQSVVASPRVRKVSLNTRIQQPESRSVQSTEKAEASVVVAAVSQLNQAGRSKNVKPLSQREGYGLCSKLHDLRIRNARDKKDRAMDQF